MLGWSLGASTATGVALLLYLTRGLLATSGFLIAVTLAALALGVWVASDRAAARRRSVALIVAYAAAAAYAALFYAEPALRSSALGGALAVLFFLAEPAYTIGAAFNAITADRRAAAVVAFLGAAFGVLAATLFLIPRLQPSVIFLVAAAALLLVALTETRPATQTMSTIEFSLAEKCAIVTGVGDRGQVGYAVARALVDAGARVCITSHGTSSVELASELGGQTVGVQADLAIADDVARLIATAHERFGRIDFVVNAAGGLRVIKPLAETSAAEWESELTRNAQTAFLVSRAALPHLRAARGAIVNFASPAGERAVAQLGAYSAAKAAVIALTRALAVEERTNGVRVNAIAPGMVDTEQNRESVGDPASTKWVKREEIANAVLFLVSDAASGITGETINVVGEGIK